MVSEGIDQRACATERRSRAVGISRRSGGGRAVFHRPSDPCLWERERIATREQARRFLLDTPGQFERFRREYFFIDRFPENDERFPLTLEACRSIEDLVSKD